MNTKIDTTNRRNYQTPHIESIKLDNEISLALQSDGNPPSGPFEFSEVTTDYFMNEPMKSFKA